MNETKLTFAEEESKMQTKLMEMLMNYAKGNPGAMTFIIDASMKDLNKTVVACERMSILDITGNKLYMIWNDCCDRNTEKTLKIMLEKGKEDILTHLNYKNGRGIPYEN